MPKIEQCGNCHWSYFVENKPDHGSCFVPLPPLYVHVDGIPTIVNTRPIRTKDWCILWKEKPE